MANTTFSGPVTSTNGFIGNLTGNVTGNVTGSISGGKIVNPTYSHVAVTANSTATLTADKVASGYITSTSAAATTTVESTTSTTEASSTTEAPSTTAAAITVTTDAPALTAKAIVDGDDSKNTKSDDGGFYARLGGGVLAVGVIGAALFAAVSYYKKRSVVSGATTTADYTRIDDVA